LADGGGTRRARLRNHQGCILDLLCRCPLLEIPIRVVVARKAPTRPRDKERGPRPEALRTIAALALSDVPKVREGNIHAGAATTLSKLLVKTFDTVSTLKHLFPHAHEVVNIIVFEDVLYFKLIAGFERPVRDLARRPALAFPLSCAVIAIIRPVRRAAELSIFGFLLVDGQLSLSPHAWCMKRDQ
jgi:hypothetical protein